MSSKDSYYFSHDSNAKNDEKIVRLRMKHGWEGYGLYWAIIERLRESSNYMSVCDFNLIAYDLRTDSAKIKSIVEDFGLFAFTDESECFYSKSLTKRMELKNERSITARKNAQKRWDKCDSNATAIPQQCKPNAIKERKVKESKVKDNFLLEKETKGENQDFLQSEISEKTKINQSVKLETSQKEKSCAKKEKAQPPDLDTFVTQAREIYQNEIKIDFTPYEFAVKAKYQSWIDAGWKDGNKKPIQNWINKLRNTIPHLKPIYGTHNNTKQSNSNGSGYSTGSNQLSKGGKITASQMVARAREEAIARHSESRN